jgi:dihydrodipicolinate synthase/N-acetylneuraminate lyase
MPPLPPRGLIAALITPLDSRREIDWGSLSDLIEGLVPYSDGLLVGEPLAGEGLALAEEMRAELFRGCFEAVGGRKPLFLCPTAGTSEETLRIAAAGEKALGRTDGGPGVFWVDLPLWHHSNRKLPQFYEEWGRRTSFPVLLYNHPLLIGALDRSLKRRNLRTAVLKRLSENEGIVGLIQAGEFQRTLHYQRAVRARRNFRIYDGEEINFLNRPSASGVLSWGANLLPAEWREIVHGALNPAEDSASGLRLVGESQKLKELAAVMRLHPAAGLKYALHRLGRIRGAQVRRETILPDSGRFREMDAFLEKNFPLQTRAPDGKPKTDFKPKEP